MIIYDVHTEDIEGRQGLFRVSAPNILEALTEAIRIKKLVEKIVLIAEHNYINSL